MLRGMPSDKPPTQPQEPAAVPLWMRKGTLWVILVLTTFAFALIAYYLLPLWWARLVNIWVGASNSWVTGLLLGFIPTTIGIAAVGGAWQFGRHHRDTEHEGLSQYVRPVLSGVAGLSIVVLSLTVFIALGVSEPLREARQLWRESAPGVLAATLVGALIALILLLGVYAFQVRGRQRSAGRRLAEPQQQGSRAEPAPRRDTPVRGDRGTTLPGPQARQGREDVGDE